MIQKEKFFDSRDDKPKAFEEIQHIHKEDPTRLQSKECDRCRYDLRELSMQEKKESIKDNETTSTIKPDGTPGPRASLRKMTVVRGRFDDVIGWALEWR